MLFDVKPLDIVNGQISRRGIRTLNESAFNGAWHNLFLVCGGADIVSAGSLNTKRNASRSPGAIGPIGHISPIGPLAYLEPAAASASLESRGGRSFISSRWVRPAAPKPTNHA